MHCTKGVACMLVRPAVPFVALHTLLLAAGGTPCTHPDARTSFHAGETFAAKGALPLPPCPLSNTTIATVRRAWEERGSTSEAPFMDWWGVGDFTLLSRELFERAGPYAETYQNLHMDIALDLILNSMGDVRKATFDYNFCHQNHTRLGRPEAPLGWQEAYDLTRLRNNSNWGLKGEVLPEAWMGDVLAAAYNPLTPYELYPHHPVFSNFSHVLWRGKLSADHVVDFLGIHTKAARICTGRGLAAGWSVLCRRHAEWRKHGYLSGPGSTYLGELPAVDEEYAVWVTLLEAVLRAKAEAGAGAGAGAGPFRVIEVHGLGLWAARAAAAMRALDPGREVRLAVVGSPNPAFAKEHLALNVPWAGAEVVGGGSDADPADDMASLRAVLQGWDSTAAMLIWHGHASHVHVDADLAGLLKEKVRAAVCAPGTRLARLRLKAAFEGWHVVEDLQPGVPRHPTPQGPVAVTRGLLSVVNPGLV